MIFWFTVILSVAAPILSAPQTGNLPKSSNSEVVVELATEQTTEIKDDSVVHIANSAGTPEDEKVQRREGEAENSNFAIIDEGLEAGSTRQNPDVPLSLDDDFGSSNPDLGFDPQSFNIPGSFADNPSAFDGGNQEAFSPFAQGPNSFPLQFGAPIDNQNQFGQVPFSQSNGFNNQQPPFAFQQRPFIPFQQSQFPQEEAPEADENRKVGFLESLFTF